jgi:hypothetical protein
LADCSSARVRSRMLASIQHCIQAMRQLHEAISVLTESADQPAATKVANIA